MDRIQDSRIQEDAYDLPSTPRTLTINDGQRDDTNSYFEPATPSRSILDDVFPNTPSFATFEELPSQKDQTIAFSQSTEDSGLSILDTGLGADCMLDLPKIPENETSVPIMNAEELRTLLADYERLQQENQEIPQLKKKVQKLSSNLNNIYKIQEESTSYYYPEKTRLGSKNLKHL